MRPEYAALLESLALRLFTETYSIVCIEGHGWAIIRGDDPDADDAILKQFQSQGEAGFMFARMADFYAEGFVRCAVECGRDDFPR